MKKKDVDNLNVGLYRIFWKDVDNLNLGLYRIFWKDGSSNSSLASVGMCKDGKKWLAPTNWRFPASGKKVWKYVERVESLISEIYSTKDSEFSNPDMDKHTKTHGLGHWTCTSTDSNVNWQREDGLKHTCNFSPPGGYVEELKRVDCANPYRLST